MPLGALKGRAVCTGEIIRFRGYQDPMVRKLTDIQAQILSLLCKGGQGRQISIVELNILALVRGPLAPPHLGGIVLMNVGYFLSYFLNF